MQSWNLARSWNFVESVIQWFVGARPGSDNPEYSESSQRQGGDQKAVVANRTDIPAQTLISQVAKEKGEDVAEEVDEEMHGIEMVVTGKVVIRRQKQEPTVLTFQLNLLPDKIRTPKCGLPPPPPTMQSHAIPHKTMQY